MSKQRKIGIIGKEIFIYYKGGVFNSETCGWAEVIDACEDHFGRYYLCMTECNRCVKAYPGNFDKIRTPSNKKEQHKYTSDNNTSKGLFGFFKRDHKRTSKA